MYFVFVHTRVINIIYVYKTYAPYWILMLHIGIQYNIYANLGSTRVYESIIIVLLLDIAYGFQK